MRDEMCREYSCGRMHSARAVTSLDNPLTTFLDTACARAYTLRHMNDIIRGHHLPATLVIVLVCTVSAAEAQRPTDFSKLQVITTQVSGNIYLLESPVSGNTAASIGRDGVLLVDA